MTRGIDTGGGDLTQVIANGMTITPRRAEEIKKERGIAIIPGQEETASLLIPLIDVIVLEIQKFIQLYTERTKREVKKIVIAGGSALLPGLVEYVAKETGKETIVGNAFSQVRYETMLEPIVREMNSVLAVSIGLALREFST
jgi:type IV pilus assembly protein PilM